MLGRPDGTRARVAPYRRLMPYLMPTRNGSAVYFDVDVDVARTEAFLERFNAESEVRASLFHVVVWAAVRTLHERPRLNRFVAGGKIWDRDGIWISYAAKTSKLDEDAPLVVLKRRFDPAASFAETVAAMSGDVTRGRSGEKTAADKEVEWLLKLPGCGVRWVLGLARRLDAWGLLPRVFLDTDPLHASLFVANLGSLAMDSGYHHLYEHGSIPIFCVIGKIADVPVVRDGAVEASRRASLKFTYDERVEDGLYAQRAIQRMRALVEDAGAPTT